MLDPFLMLDEFQTENPDDYLAGFPDRPHRGFETVTYMIHGAMEDYRERSADPLSLKAGSAARSAPHPDPFPAFAGRGSYRQRP